MRPCHGEQGAHPGLLPLRWPGQPPCHDLVNTAERTQSDYTTELCKKKKWLQFFRSGYLGTKQEKRCRTRNACGMTLRAQGMRVGMRDDLLFPPLVRPFRSSLSWLSPVNPVNHWNHSQVILTLVPITAVCPFGFTLDVKTKNSGSVWKNETQLFSTVLPV